MLTVSTEPLHITCYTVHNYVHNPFPLRGSCRAIATTKEWDACMKDSHYRIQLYMRGHVHNLVRGLVRRHVRNTFS